MSWLEMQGGRLPLEQAEAVFAAATKELQRQSPQQLSAWLASHLDHPQRDDMIEGATDALIQAGDLAGAPRMPGAIRSLEKRNQVTAILQNHTAAEQKQPNC